MSARTMRAGLAHEWQSSGDTGAFFSQIDATGGWPVGFQYVGFEHTDERAAGFTNSPHNDGWWTVVAHADDYYLWKLSDAALQRIADAAIDAIRLPRIDITKVWLRGSSNSLIRPRATLKQGTQP